MTWTFQSFGAIGYVGLAVSLAVPVLWSLGLLRRTGPRPLVVAVLVAALSLVCAQVNSTFHVNRLEPDRSAAVAAARKAEEALHQKKVAALDATREQSAADIQFAEDAKDDALDKAGLDDADLKYLETIEEEDSAAEPGWKQKKKARGEGTTSDDSLEAGLDSDNEPAGLDAGQTVAESSWQPIVVSEEAYATAHRVDRWNLWWSRFLVVAAVAVLARDWLRRANDYATAYLPLPVPSAVVNAGRQLPSLVVRPRPPRRSMPEELAWLLHRGDCFVFLAASPAAADAAQAALTGFERRRRPVQILHVGSDGEDCGNRFIFESLWYGRCSFLLDDPTRAERLVKDFCIFLEERQATRARAAQIVHVVWDLAGAAPPDQATASAFIERWKRLIQAVSSRGRRAGFSVFLCRESEPARPTSSVESAA